MSPLPLSLGIAAAATVLVTLLGVPLAYALGRKSFRGRAAIETLLTLPLVLPPTVVGYLIIVVLGARGWVGAWLRNWFDYTIMFRVEGAVLASAIVSFPLLYLPSKAAFAGVEHELEEAAALLGASHWQTFWQVSLPLAYRGIASGQVLAFARALGEFGATVMVFGWQPQRLTMPIAIYSAYEQGDVAAAVPIVLVMTGICLILLLLFNRVGQRRTR